MAQSHAIGNRSKEAFSHKNQFGGFDSLSKQHTAMPFAFLTWAARLGLDPTAMVIVWVIKRYQWTASLPRPAKATIAQLAGVSEKTVERKLKELESMGVLIVHSGGSASNIATNLYDLRPLWQALDALERETPLEDVKRELALAAWQRKGQAPQSVDTDTEDITETEQPDPFDYDALADEFGR